MKSTDKLYETFGELIYLVAMADGEIQPEELLTIEQMLAGHPWGEDIKWSFEYEVRKNNDLEDLYKKVIYYCEEHGPDKEYAFMMKVLEEVAKSSAGIDEHEEKIMNDFVRDLTNKFREDIDRINAELP